MMEVGIPYLGVLAAVITVLVVLLIRQNARLRKLEKLLDLKNTKLENLQIKFGRFTPEEVIEHLTEADGSYRPSRRPVTVLFADLQGFTRMCSTQDPEVVVEVLNGYFKCMSDAIAKHHGQVTELLGDGILALFGAVRANPWQVQDAVKAALAMRASLKEYNVTLRQKEFPDLSFGIGIHHGEVLVGIMGNFELSKFGVVGDAINTAARVEALTREHGVDILITESVRRSLDERFIVNAMPPMSVKGKEQPLQTYSVVKMKGDRVLEKQSHEQR